MGAIVSVSEVWEPFVPQDELDRFSEKGFGADEEPGERPLLLVIDVVESFLGPREVGSGTQAPADCGPMGWERLPNIVELLDRARSAGTPVVYCKGDLAGRLQVGGSVKMELDPQVARANHDTQFPPEISPLENEWVISKTKASALNSTPLEAYLVRHKIDTIVACGVSTSGCVRATVVDAFSFGMRVFVVEPACFDRSNFAHAASLFDIQQKYGTVVDLTRGGEILDRNSQRSAQT
jgi:maleamate amidohydrolase